MVWKKYHHAIAKLFSEISRVMYENTESNVSVDVVGLINTDKTIHNMYMHKNDYIYKVTPSMGFKDCNMNCLSAGARMVTPVLN